MLERLFFINSLVKKILSSTLILGSSAVCLGATLTTNASKKASESKPQSSFKTRNRVSKNSKSRLVKILNQLKKLSPEEVEGYLNSKNLTPKELAWFRKNLLKSKVPNHEPFPVQSVKSDLEIVDALPNEMSEQPQPIQEDPDEVVDVSNIKTVVPVVTHPDENQVVPFQENMGNDLAKQVLEQQNANNAVRPYAQSTSTYGAEKIIQNNVYCTLL